MVVFLELLKTGLNDAHDCSAKSAGFAPLLLLCFGSGSLPQQVHAFWRFSEAKLENLTQRSKARSRD